MRNREQGKISMVVPCYNKDKYIGAMPGSVIAQSRALAGQTRDLINQINGSDIEIGVTKFFDRGYDTVFRAIKSRYLKKDKAFKRIIGYGALGKNVLSILPQLVGSQYCPTELWDKGGDGYRVKLPDFDLLLEELKYPQLSRFEV